jgi:hypothetical protein
VLTTARAFGWEPEGTTDPYIPFGEDKSEWRGGYLTNDGQQVSSDDARALADALIRAIDAATKCQVEVNRPHLATSCDSPNTDPVFDGSLESMRSAGGIVQKNEGDDCANDSDLELIRENTRYVLEFVDFLRGGAFRLF